MNLSQNQLVVIAIIIVLIVIYFWNNKENFTSQFYVSKYVTCDQKKRSCVTDQKNPVICSACPNNRTICYATTARRCGCMANVVSGNKITGQACNYQT